MGFFERLKEGLSKTRRNFTDRIQELVGLSAAIDDDFLDELEMILLSADVGVKTTEKLIDAVRKAAKKKEISCTEDVIPFLKKYMAEMLADSGQRTRIGAKPTVILVVGVNGRLLHPRGQKGDAGRRRYLPCRSRRATADLGRACALRRYPPC